MHGVERRLDVYRPGTYFGELPILLGAPAIASIRAIEPSRVAQLDTGDFHALFAECTTFAGELTRTMTTALHAPAVARRDVGAGVTVTIVGHRYDIACHRLRDFLARNHVLFRWLDPTRPDLAGEAPPPQTGDRYPVVVLTDGRRLVTPTLRELADALGLATAPRRSLYDVAIVGAGPAGLAAAVYGASEGLATLLVEREAPGGPGEHVVAHRELPGLSDRRLRRRARRPRTAAGAALRRRARWSRAKASHWTLRAPATVGARDHARRRRARARAQRDARHRRRLARARRTGRRRARRAAASTTAPRAPRR